MLFLHNQMQVVLILCIIECRGQRKEIGLQKLRMNQKELIKKLLKINEQFLIVH